MTRPEWSEIDRLDRLARLLDDQYRIPGTTIRFGLDALLGLIPGLGDSAMSIVSLYIPLRARSVGAPWRLVFLMLLNILIDFLIGLIPVLGDIADIGWRANRRNVTLLRRHFGMY